MTWMKTLHKWLGLIVGVQVLIWLLTGFFFSIMDHEKASGNQYRNLLPAVSTIESGKLISEQQVLSLYPKAQQIRLIEILGQATYIVTLKKGLYRHFENHYQLVDAYTGNSFIIDENKAKQIAQNSYFGPGQVSSVSKLFPPIADEPKQKKPLWQINFDDDQQTSVYVEVASGRLIGHSSDYERLVDLLFILHFMDYASEGSFNNWQIIIFSLLTLLLTISGIIWVLELCANKQYVLQVLSRTTNIEITNDQDKSLAQLNVAKGANILDALGEHHIELPSLCGGGGLCGKCIVKLEATAKITAADEQRLSREQIQQGIRLSCQHSCRDNNKVSLLANRTDSRSSDNFHQANNIQPIIKS